MAFQEPWADLRTEENGTDTAGFPITSEGVRGTGIVPGDLGYDSRRPGTLSIAFLAPRLPNQETR